MHLGEIQKVGLQISYHNHEPVLFICSMIDILGEWSGQWELRWVGVSQRWLVESLHCVIAGRSAFRDDPLRLQVGQYLHSTTYWRSKCSTQTWLRDSTSRFGVYTRLRPRGTGAFLHGFWRSCVVTSAGGAGLPLRVLRLQPASIPNLLY